MSRKTTLWKIRLHAASPDHRPAAIIRQDKAYPHFLPVVGAITFGEMKWELTSHHSIKLFGDNEDECGSSNLVIEDDRYTCFIWTRLSYDNIRKLLDETFKMDTSTSVYIGGMGEYSSKNRIDPW